MGILKYFPVFILFFYLVVGKYLRKFLRFCSLLFRNSNHNSSFKIKPKITDVVDDGIVGAEVVINENFGQTQVGDVVVRNNKFFALRGYRIHPEDLFQCRQTILRVF